MRRLIFFASTAPSNSIGESSSKTRFPQTKVQAWLARSTLDFQFHPELNILAQPVESFFARLILVPLSKRLSERAVAGVALL